ncbi:unnamed protein product, partial [Ranitomeya imitator]
MGGARPIAARCQLPIAADIRHYVPGAVTDRPRHINPWHTAIKDDRDVPAVQGSIAQGGGSLRASLSPPQQRDVIARIHKSRSHGIERPWAFGYVISLMQHRDRSCGDNIKVTAPYYLRDFRYAVAQASRHLGKPVIEDKILNQILYYLPQLYELNRDVLRELKERMSQWSEQQKIADIFLKKGPYLKMYSTYIREFDRNVSLLDEQCKKNAAFAGVVKDFEMSPRCANLALKHYLLKPVQRIPQYRLLLTDYLQNLSQESSDYSDTQDGLCEGPAMTSPSCDWSRDCSRDRDIIEAALSVVIEVANHANDILKHGDNFQKLMQIQYSLNGHHEIVQPGRVCLR